MNGTSSWYTLNLVIRDLVVIEKMFMYNICVIQKYQYDIKFNYTYLNPYTINNKLWDNNQLLTIF